jgi:tetratricopeptide (TPR) repeat protein
VLAPFYGDIGVQILIIQTESSEIAAGTLMGPTDGWRGEMTALNKNGIPLEAQYLYRHALDLSIEGKKESALKYLSMAVCIAPCFCNAYNAMGNCLDELGQFGAAVNKYDKVLEINPFHAEARLKRALIMKKIGRAGELKRGSSYVKIQENEKSTYEAGGGDGSGRIFRFTFKPQGEVLNF